MIRLTPDGLPIVDPAWQHDELSDRGEPEELGVEAEDEGDPSIDGRLDAAFEERVSGEGEDDPQGWSDAPW
jgi:hypothetical protein